MRALLVSFAALGAVLVTSCQREPDPGNASAAGNETAAAGNVAAPVRADAEAMKVEAKDDELEFSYGWPAAAAAIAPLDEWLRGNMAHHRERMTKMAREGAADARKNGYPVRAYGYDQGWSVVADTPALLVLEAQGYEYTGGAHGMPFVSTLIWDKAKSERLATGALLDAAALARAARTRFCAALDAQRAEKRGEPVEPGADDPVPEFNRCVALEKQEIVPVSTNGKGIDRLRIEIMPYEAGPYAEGVYTVELPVDAGVIGAVRPAWKAAFTQ